MWWTMPEAGEQQGAGVPVRRLAVAGSFQRRQRTVLTLVPLRDVHPNPEQPRKHFDDEKLRGERRLHASKKAGKTYIPALVRRVSRQQAAEMTIVENLQREDLSPLEEAEGLATLIARHGYSHREVAELLGKSRPYVSNILALTRLPEAVKVDLQRDGGLISRELLMGVARQEDPETALALWRRLQLGVLSVRRFREEKAGRRPERAAVAEVLAAGRRMNRALARLLADELPASDAPRIARALRRTRRLIDRQLEAVSPPAPPGP